MKVSGSREKIIQILGWVLKGLVIIGFFSVSSILATIIPIFEKMFADMGGQLPALTQFFIWQARFWWLYVVAGVLFIGSFLRTAVFQRTSFVMALAVLFLGQVLFYILMILAMYLPIFRLKS